MFAYDLWKGCNILDGENHVKELRSGAFGQSLHSRCFRTSQTRMQRGVDHQVPNQILQITNVSKPKFLTTLMAEGSIITLGTLSIPLSEHGAAFKSSKRFRILRIE